MSIKQQAHLKMLIAVLGVLDKFKALWQAIPAFLNGRNDLSAAIDAVNAEELKQAGITTGITENKRIARKAMCDSAIIVAGAIGAWADRQNNHELFNTVDFTAPDLMHRPEQECVTHCKAIYDAGLANLAALIVEKTLTQADLDDLSLKIKAFNALLTKPREAKALTKGATDHIPERLEAGDRVLERQLDRLMPRFQTSNADFYAAYQVARVIVNPGGGSGNGDDPNNPTNPPTPPTTPK
ncbi:MAG: hypothetical protein RLY20_389 [Verrucomicrobiota bacterium]|jgi:hypothetical protein